MQDRFAYKLITTAAPSQRGRKSNCTVIPAVVLLAQKMLGGGVPVGRCPPSVQRGGSVPKGGSVLSGGSIVVLSNLGVRSLWLVFFARGHFSEVMVFGVIPRSARSGVPLALHKSFIAIVVLLGGGSTVCG